MGLGEAPIYRDYNYKRLPRENAVQSQVLEAFFSCLGPFLLQVHCP